TAFKAESGRGQAKRAAAAGSAKGHGAEARRQACRRWPPAAEAVGGHPRRQGQSGLRLRTDRVDELVRKPLRSGEVRGATVRANCTTRCSASARHPVLQTFRFAEVRSVPDHPPSWMMTLSPALRD